MPPPLLSITPPRRQLSIAAHFAIDIFDAEASFQLFVFSLRHFLDYAITFTPIS
jgi:hypothetical protein